MSDGPGRASLLEAETTYYRRAGVTMSSGMCFAWFDTRAVLGARVEVYEESDLMRCFNRRVAQAAEGWSGENPIRSL